MEIWAAVAALISRVFESVLSSVAFRGLQRLFGIETTTKCEEPNPYQLQGIQMPALRADPEVGASIVAAESRGRNFAFAYKPEIQAKLQEGYVPFLTDDGLTCEFDNSADPKGPLSLLISTPPLDPQA